MRKFKENKLYVIDFLDHHCGSRDVGKISIVGWFVKEDKSTYVFKWWKDLESNEDKDQEYVTIVKSTVTKSRKI